VLVNGTRAPTRKGIATSPGNTGLVVPALIQRTGKFNREQIEQRFGATFAADVFTPRYNAAPSQSLPVILNAEPTTIQFVAWGLRPAWMAKVTKTEGIINVRAETLRTRPTFKRDLAERCCLVLADGFYEWKKTGKQKIPYRIALKSGEPFAFAGIWEENIGDDGHALKTFAIITTGANPLVGLVHDRMPVILRKETERQWSNSAIPEDKVVQLLDAYPANLLWIYEIAPRVNRTTEDSPELIKPVQ
jgi:putative SOS response-associated peptidase YedK